MTKFSFLKIIMLAFLSVFLVETVFACSMYKVTVNGKTMVGNNEDSWGRDPKIWFVQGTKEKFGVACVGYSRKQPNPDGAMNEHGLAFDAFTMHRKGNLPERNPAKKDFAYSRILTIMQSCKTVDEVYAFLDTLNLHILDGSPIFNGGMLLFVDKSGKYLVVEANKMTLGNDNKFALANFSFSDTKDLSTIKTERYCKGVTFLNNKEPKTDLSFCTALSDTMSVRRAKVSNGTLYTSIYDLTEGLVHVYFYHDFGKCVTFNLKEELAKGDHSYDFVQLFPDNKNFQRFIAYQTPQNSKPLFIILLACGLLFFFSFFFFLLRFFKTANDNYKYLNIGMSVLSLALGIYVLVLLRNEGIFYFPSPYDDGMSLLVSLSSYLPFVLLISLIPLAILTVNIIRQQKWKGMAKGLLLTNLLAYFILSALFFYWNLFDVFK